MVPNDALGRFYILTPSRIVQAKKMGGGSLAGRQVKTVGVLTEQEGSGVTRLSMSFPLSLYLAKPK